jgi:molecular chaperone DnaK (HSP70)
VSDPIIGIDLGTTNSAASYLDEAIAMTTPSALWRSDRTVTA